MNNQSSTILVIVSPNEQLKEITSFLQKKALKIEEYNPQQNLIEQIKNTQPDLLLLDNNLPAGDSFQLLKEIKRESEFKDIPLILLLEQEAKINNYLEFEPIDYIKKPFESEELWLRIKLNLSLSRGFKKLEASKDFLKRTKNYYTKAIGKISFESSEYLKKVMEVMVDLEKSPRIGQAEKEEIRLIYNQSQRLFNILSLTAHLNKYDSKSERHKESKLPKKPLKILLAEDTAMNQKVAIHMLKKLGYDADVVENGVEVLEALKNKSYDLILMDLMMPEMDGLEATRRIYQDFAGDKRPTIIAVTANVLPESREACFAVGMNGYITKPFYLETLAQVLEQCNEQKDS